MIHRYTKIIMCLHHHFYQFPPFGSSAEPLRVPGTFTSWISTRRVTSREKFETDYVHRVEDLAKHADAMMSLVSLSGVPGVTDVRLTKKTGNNKIRQQHLQSIALDAILFHNTTIASNSKSQRYL